MDCEFCTVKDSPRSSSVERVVRQVASLVETHNIRFFFLVDDLFGQNRKQTLRLCRMLADYQRAARVRLNITVQIRLDLARDAELLKEMRRAGVNIVCIGYESPIPEELEAMNKRIKPAEMLELTRLYHRAGLLIHGMFMFGYPLPEGRTLNLTPDQRVREFSRFIKRARLETLQVLLTVPAPGTALHDRLSAQNRIFPLDSIGWEYYDGNFPVFMPDPPMTPEKMLNSVSRIMSRFYRFRSMFAVARQVIVFPYLVFFLGNLARGWRKWTVDWRKELLRFGGWVTLRQWAAEFRKSRFSRKLKEAQRRLD
jgi:radical SAM superfamily enzyme YgiQ (UPF0313 family)